jgi:hypothetical protein
MGDYDKNQGGQGGQDGGFDKGQQQQDGAGSDKGQQQGGFDKPE